ncbi:hypothetical protein CAPTEDRAFT_182182 [Capitella teleta]|uniref:ADP-ribosylglycohydrolase n=1 Tax=Capitella teleta TaxID=283909 RepID=R7U7D7_CAPTE|nr:hypothetical protein CAPTEDRAFT_182182 [Capitella teleta]|eukprot:ELU02280.1 hypothetical protein CAPTEDRAFT_182182 [Capitella teleta]
MISQADRAKHEALWGMFVADAIAMPVHWFYNPYDIKRSYGQWLSGYVAPTESHPSSILNLSSIGGSGRSGSRRASKPVVGNVILHDKAKYWTSGKKVHYHRGMSAGDSTLNALTALETIKVMNLEDAHCSLDLETLQAKVMENYVDFMTKPGTHNDTYAESFHRLFFKEWSEMESPPRKGEDIVHMAKQRFRSVTAHSEDHQIAVIGALVVAIPWVLHYSHKSADECANAVVSSLQLTHPAPSLMPYVEMYSRLLHSVINGAQLKDQVIKFISSGVLGRTKKSKIIQNFVDEARQYSDTESRLMVYQEGTSTLGSACYIDGAVSSMLMLALGFHDDFSGGVLTNANCGGENAHRGAALGALLGANAAINGKEIASKWKEGLMFARKQLNQATQKI